jgi:hypothetical protein
MLLHVSNTSFVGSIDKMVKILDWPPAINMRPYLKNKVKRAWRYGSGGGTPT